ncbi:hypothetical protein ACM9HO_13070 [Pseudomonas sp. KHB2.9]
MKGLTRLAASLVLLALSTPAWCAKKVDLDYHVKLLPQSDQAEVRVSLSQGSAVILKSRLRLYSLRGFAISCSLPWSAQEAFSLAFYTPGTRAIAGVEVAVCGCSDRTCYI